MAVFEDAVPKLSNRAAPDTLPEGNHVTDMMVFDAMRMDKKARDLSLPQPQLPMYYGHAGKNIEK